MTLLLALLMVGAEPTARTLVDDWVRVQNEGNFAAYEKLYAQRFTGVRRSGPRVVRLDRKGWLKDRQRMFKHVMVVAASEVKIAPAGEGATATFVQTWSAPESGYRDVGRKVLVFMPEGGALRIVREEMLESKLMGAARAASDSDRFAVVVGGRVVLTTEVIEPWSTGAPALTNLGGPGMAVSRKVDPAKIPAPLRAWNGKKVRLFAFGGPVCEGTVTAFEHVRRVVPHFSEPQEWRQNDTPDAEIARALWDEASGSDLLVGKLAEDGGCKDAKWARLASLPAPEIFQPAGADGALERRALRELRKLPAWKNMQADYQREGHKGNWDQHGGARPTVKRLGPLVYVTADVGESCGDDFVARLWGVWEVAGNKLVDRNAPDANGFVEPAAATDVDGDGVLEILIDEGILRREGERYGAPEHLDLPDHDCPC